MVENLPKIYIEVILNLSEKDRNSEYFFGENNREEKELYGIYFTCEFDKDLGAYIEKEVGNGSIPYEYYTLKWTTFAGLPYYSIKKPFGFISIDTSSLGVENTYNYYNRTLFNNIYPDDEKLKIKNSFRENLNSAINQLDLEKIDDNREFGINAKKVIFEQVISVYEDGISLENKGSGMESVIKMEMALNKSKSNLDVILIEEPENHLSHSNMKKMISNILESQEQAQLIITTHNNLISSRLGLNNILWFDKEKTNNLKNVDETTAKFFQKVDDNSLLEFLL